MDEPLRAHSPNEVEFFLQVTACPKCGHGPMEAKDVQPEGDGDPTEPSRGAKVRALCKRCGAQATYHFRWDAPAPAPGDCVNPTDRPSTLIDLGQWVGLCYRFQEEADRAASPAEAHQAHRRAALCLDEALKFHLGEELPPESAFFTETSLAGFRSNPALYARTRLREFQALLPTAVVTADPPPPATAEPHHAWWRFWAR